MVRKKGQFNAAPPLTGFQRLAVRRQRHLRVRADPLLKGHACDANRRRVLSQFFGDDAPQHAAALAFMLHADLHGERRKKAISVARNGNPPQR